MQSILLGLFNGLTYGMLLFLMASGLTLVFSMLGVLNFSHTAFYTLGAYFAYTASQLLGLGFWMGLLVSPACCALLGAVIERFGIRHVLRYGLLGPLLLTFGLHLALIELVGLIWGKSPVAYAMPVSLNVPLFSLYGIDYSAYRAFTLVMTLAVLALLVVTLKCTRIGTTVRASLSHPDIVNTLGHNLPLLRNMVFAAGAALAGLAGALSGNLLGTETRDGRRTRRDSHDRDRRRRPGIAGRRARLVASDRRAADARDIDRGAMEQSSRTLARAVLMVGRGHRRTGSADQPFCATGSLCHRRRGAGPSPARPDGRPSLNNPDHVIDETSTQHARVPFRRTLIGEHRRPHRLLALSACRATPLSAGHGVDRRTGAACRVTVAVLLAVRGIASDSDMHRGDVRSRL
ncbi:branched-chain amino acid ABC transporter permease [Paraburkholderia youngii]|uniref:branched-chain amino acid ABC transporter permease n=1 Tax=Paraburkholderia youngii TaxID=2782701 RepID=UPI003D214E23